MSTAPRSREKRLSGKQVHAWIIRRFKRYDHLSFLEQFAMFIGKAQLVEAALKQLLVTRFSCSEEKMEHWSLGRTIGELKEHGVRPDFIKLLEELNEYRNYAAHDMLAYDTVLNKLGSRAQRGA
jgi:hypothetical protein